MPTASWGYRPFISTDAAVADPKEVEIELGYLTLEREKDENAFVIPRVVVNYGFVKNWEAVAEFAVRRSPDAEVDLIDPALFLKGVLKEGVPQDKTDRERVHGVERHDPRGIRDVDVERVRVGIEDCPACPTWHRDVGDPSPAEDVDDGHAE